MSITTEIERKFLVHNTAMLSDLKGRRITQGYLSTDNNRTVRVRIYGDKAYITIKGASTANGLSRLEWEKEIAVTEAVVLLELCLPTIIDKTRYELQLNDLLWEIDVFHKENAPLILAEVELKSENQKITLPDWIKEEVTGDTRYYNSYLSQRPFSSW